MAALATAGGSLFSLTVTPGFLVAEYFSAETTAFRIFEHGQTASFKAVYKKQGCRWISGPGKPIFGEELRGLAFLFAGILRLLQKKKHCFLGTKLCEPAGLSGVLFFHRRKRDGKTKTQADEKRTKEKRRDNAIMAQERGKERTKEMPQRRKINAVKAENAGKGRRGWPKGHGRNDDIVVT